MTDKIDIQEDIFQDLVQFYGNLFSLPPLAAKIYALLIFDFSAKGKSFDELVGIFSASKSSVSSALKLLMKADLVSDFSKPDERKRYFVLNGDYLRLRFTQIISRLKTEIELLDRLQVFRGEEDPKYSAYRSLMLKNISNIENSLSKF